MIRNAIVLILALASYFLFLVLLSDSIPAEQRLWVNFFAVPLVLGSATSFSLSTPLLNSILLVALVPILPILFYGGDPAKPGMELLVLGPLAVMFAVGGAIGGALRRTAKQH